MISSEQEMNQQVIKEFRTNAGRVGGYLEGKPVVLVHHRGRTSGREYVNPMTYLTAPDKQATISRPSGSW